MLARVAENLYWLGRYLERAENVARLCDVTRLYESENTILEPWEPVLATLNAEEDFAEAQKRDPSILPEQFVVDSADSPISIRAVIAQVRTLAMGLREYLSREVFEEINRVYLPTVSKTRPLTRTTTQNVRRSVATVYGIYENMVLHLEGSHWFRLGRLLERADMTSRLVDEKYYLLLPSSDDVGGPVDRSQWRSLLLTASALEAYRRRFRVSVTADRVVDLLFFDESFPRSLLYCAIAMQVEFAAATSETPSIRTKDTAGELSDMIRELRALRGDAVISEGLHDFIDAFQQHLGRINGSMVADVFRALPEQTQNYPSKMVSTLSLQSE